MRFEKISKRTKAGETIEATLGVPERLEELVSAWGETKVLAAALKAYVREQRTLLGKKPKRVMLDPKKLPVETLEVLRELGIKI